MMLRHLDAFDTQPSLGGWVSIWCAPLGSDVPAYGRDERRTHYAASTMKIAVLATLYGGPLDVDAEVPVVNEFTSATPGAGRYGQSPADDHDRQVWERLGDRASLSWLARRMIVASGNLATNIVLSHVGADAVADVMISAGAIDGRIQRGIGDLAARDAGIDNQVSARDLAMLLNHIAVARRSDDMLEILFAQELREDLAAGLPSGVRLAHKNGFIHGIRHGAGIVFPDDAPPYTIVVCTTSLDGENRTDERSCDLIAQIAAASWADRHDIGARSVG